MTLAEQLRALADTHGPHPVAAALARTAPPLARAVLALDRGLLSPLGTRDALHSVPEAALAHVPTLPDVPPTHRETWLRHLAAHVLLNTPWTGQTSARPITTSLIPDPQGRLTHAVTLAHTHRRPVTYAAANWAAAQAAQDWVTRHASAPLTVITLEEAILTLGGASRTRLHRLAELTGQILILDGLHRLDPRGLRPIQALIDEHAALGLRVHLTGAHPWPLQPPAPTAQHTPPPITFENATWLTSLDDLEQHAQANADRHTLIHLPSRRAALDVQARLPGAHLQARTKTSAHLRDEQHTTAALHVSTWSPAALTFRPYDHVITTPAPLPILADACLAAPRMTLLHAPYPVSSAATTGTHLTMDLLRGGAHPQDPTLMRTYWDTLLPHVQQDSLGIMTLRAQQQYPQVAAALASLFQSGVQVLVNHPTAAPDVERARRTGRLPIASPHTVRMTHASVTAAREQGWIEDAGDTLIWNGPYATDRGVGVP